MCHTYKVFPEKVQPLLTWEQFARYRCNLAVKESGLEYACVSEHVYCVAVAFQMAE